MKKHSYKSIVEHFVKIIGNGTFAVETINESILIKMLKSRGINIPIKDSYRDIDKDYKMANKENTSLKEQLKESKQATKEQIESSKRVITETMTSDKKVKELLERVVKIINEVEENNPTFDFNENLVVQLLQNQEYKKELENEMQMQTQLQEHYEELKK